MAMGRTRSGINSATVASIRRSMDGAASRMESAAAPTSHPMAPANNRRKRSPRTQDQADEYVRHENQKQASCVVGKR